jgi:hypothetical protein
MKTAWHAAPLQSVSRRHQVSIESRRSAMAGQSGRDLFRNGNDRIMTA